MGVGKVATWSDGTKPTFTARRYSMPLILIGVLAVLAAAALAKETGSLLLGESADLEQVEDLRRMIAMENAVERVGDVLTTQLSPDEIFLVADIGFRDGLQPGEL